MYSWFMAHQAQDSWRLLELCPVSGYCIQMTSYPRQSIGKEVQLLGLSHMGHGYLVVWAPTK